MAFGNAQRTGRGAGGQNTLRVRQPEQLDLALRVLGHELRPAQGERRPSCPRRRVSSPSNPFQVSALQLQHTESRNTGYAWRFPPALPGDPRQRCQHGSLAPCWGSSQLRYWDPVSPA